MQPLFSLPNFLTPGEHCRPDDMVWHAGSYLQTDPMYQPHAGFSMEYEESYRKKHFEDLGRTKVWIFYILNISHTKPIMILFLQKLPNLFAVGMWGLIFCLSPCLRKCAVRGLTFFNLFAHLCRSSYNPVHNAPYMTKWKMLIYIYNRAMSLSGIHAKDIPYQISM